MSSFQEAERDMAKLKVLLTGVSGGGKTYTMMIFLFALALHEAKKRGSEEPRVAVVESEKGRLKKYVGLAPHGTPWRFKVAYLTSFAPTEYVAKIEEAGRAGFDAIGIDSLSHEWQGKGGVLEMVDRNGKGQGWKDATPLHNMLIDAMLMSPAHIVATARSKIGYSYERNEQNKVEPKKIGMKPITRPGMEYEFDIVGDLDQSHILTISKSMCPAIDNAKMLKPGPDFLQPVLEWLESGEVSGTVKFVSMLADDEQVRRIIGKLAELRRDAEKEKEILFKRYRVREFAQLKIDEAADYEKRLDIDLAAKRKQAEQPKPAATPAATAAPAEQSKPATETTNGKHTPPPAGGTQSFQSTGVPMSVPSDGPPAAPKADDPAAPRSTDGVTATVGQLALNELIALKAEYFHWCGIADPAVIAEKWAPVLEKRGVTHESKLSPEAVAALALSLKKKINALAAEAGQPAQHQVEELAGRF